MRVRGRYNTPDSRLSGVGAHSGVSTAAAVPHPFLEIRVDTISRVASASVDETAPVGGAGALRADSASQVSLSLAIEIAPFTLAEGVVETAMLAASERLEREFLRGTEGYLGRAVSQLAEGRWADIVLWRSPEHAAAVLPKIPESAACAAYFGCMVGADPADPTHGVSIFRAVRRYGALAAA